MSSTYGENLKLSIFGQSHGPAIGMTLDGIPAGLPVDFDKLQQFLNRRAPGQNDWSTPRREADRPEFLGGILEGYTCGAPIAAIIRNTNIRQLGTPFCSSDDTIVRSGSKAHIRRDISRHHDNLLFFGGNIGPDFFLRDE